MSFIINLEKKDGMTEEQYLWMIGQKIESGEIKNWESVNSIINKELLGEDETTYRTESAWRKKYQAAKKFYDGCFSKMKSDTYAKEVEELNRELERNKIKFRDERRAWNKQNYIEARVENRMDYLEEQLKSIGNIQFKIERNSLLHYEDSDNDMIILLSDFHIGAEFYSAWGCYNNLIAKKRMEQLLNNTLSIKETHKCNNCYVMLAGDMISGSIHKSVQVTNSENVIEQIKFASELIANFCYELCNSFENVTMTSVVGNHTRLERKDDALHNERLDTIISWSVGNLLNHIDNFTIDEESNIDIGISVINVKHKNYFLVHGDYDQFNKSGLNNLCMHLGFKPEAVFLGHMHTCALMEENGVKMIRGGSLCGSGDDYTIEKRLSGKPSQMITIINSNGINALYPVELD